jgi:ABC-type nitrate/sulfonate/bicarbonate transport system substrate-binding protein
MMRVTKSSKTPRAVFAFLLILMGSSGIFAGGSQENAVSHDSEPAVSSRDVTEDHGPVKITVSTPPDPNIIPLAVLRQKAQAWDLGFEVVIQNAPAGDPGAMRAMIHDRRVDFALFNALGGTKFYNAGLDNLRLVGTHVWRGVYLLARDSVAERADLDGATVLAVPGVQNPPHVLSMRALAREGIRPEFVPGGSGPALMALLSQPDRAPMGFVAPEPMVSIILGRQESDDWSVRYRVFVDPQEMLSPTGEIPLGSLWLVNPDILTDHPDAAREFVAAFDRATDYVNNPANHEEVARMVAEALTEIYSQSAGASVYRAMLESGRLGMDYRSAGDIRDFVTTNLMDLYDVEARPEMFCVQL